MNSMHWKNIQKCMQPGAPCSLHGQTALAITGGYLCQKKTFLTSFDYCLQYLLFITFKAAAPKLVVFC